MKERYFVLVRFRNDGDRWRFASARDADGAVIPFESSDFDKAVIKAIAARSDEIEAIVVQQVEP